jgi:AI-2 transport protein TqsA
MKDESHPRSGNHPLVLTAAFVIVVWGITLAQSVLILLLVAMFLAVLGVPPALWLQRKRVPSALAVLLVVSAMIGVLFLVGGLVGASLANFTNKLPWYQSRLEEQVGLLETFLAGKGIQNADKILTDYLNPAVLMRLTANLLSGLGSTLSNMFLILLIVTFILLETSGFPAKLHAAFGNRPPGVPQFVRFMDDIKLYVIVKTGVSVTTGLLVGIWLVVLGVDSPALWAFLSFLLNYVPNLGVIIAAVPAALLALIQFGFGRALLVVVGYLAVNIVIGTFIEPRLVGRQVGLSTLVVFLSLIFWGSIFGLIGAVLCVPLTMALKFWLEIDDRTRGIAILLGRDVTEPGRAIHKEHKS